MTVSKFELDIPFETKKIELKQILNDGPQAESWLKTVAGFANGEGGDIYVGINDVRESVGLTKDLVDKQVQLFHRNVKAHLAPLPKYDFSYHQIAHNLYVIQIHIHPSQELPVVLSMHGIPSIYVREEGQNRAADHIGVGRARAGPDDEPHDQKLHQHGRSADHRQIHLADPVQNPKYNSFFLLRLLIMGRADNRHQHAQNHSQNQGKYRHQERDPNTFEKILVIIIQNKGLIKSQLQFFYKFHAAIPPFTTAPVYKGQTQDPLLSLVYRRRRRYKTRVSKFCFEHPR